MKKSVWSMASLVLAAALVAGCGGNGGGNGNASESPAASGGAGGAKSDVTLTYIASQGWIKDPEMELAKKFEAETGIKIDYQIVPADQYFNVLKTKLNSGEGPDIFGGQSGKSEIQLNYNVEKNAVDLSGEEWATREDPLSKDQLSLNGKLYALTIWDTYNSFVVTYNKKLFAELSLSVPKTYAEFKAAALKIKDSGVTPLFEPIADGWHHQMWFTEIGPRYDEMQPNLYDDLNANKATFAGNGPMTTSLTQLKEMYDLGFFGDNAFSDVGSDTPNKLGSGEYAMSLATQSAPAEIAAAFPDLKAEDFGYFVIPLADNQIYYINPGGPSKFIYSGSKHIEEAKQYFDFLTKQENLQYMLDNDPTVANLNFPGLTDKYTDDQKALFAANPVKGTDIQNYVNYFNPQWMDIGKDLQAMFGGAMTPEDVLKNIDKRRADMAKVAKDTAWGN